jgi:hypothetical protein
MTDCGAETADRKVFGTNIERGRGTLGGQKRAGRLKVPDPGAKLALVWAVALMVAGAPIALSTAQAQFVCDSVVPGGADGATTDGSAGSFACGTDATANGVNSTALGDGALAEGFSSTSTRSRKKDASVLYCAAPDSWATAT